MTAPRALLLLLALAAPPPAAAADAPLPIMRWYLGEKCVGTPGATVQLALGCADYQIFGTLLTLYVFKNPSGTYGITTYTYSGCTGAIGIVFADVPYPSSSSACTAASTLDRWAWGSARAARPRPPRIAHPAAPLFAPLAVPTLQPLFYKIRKI